MTAEWVKLVTDQWSLGRMAFAFLRRPEAEGRELDPGTFLPPEFSQGPVYFYNLKPLGHEGPMEPLLSLLRQRYHEVGPRVQERLWSQIQVYPPHLGFLKSWLDEGQVDRWDDLFRAPTELIWERAKLMGALSQILGILWEGQSPVFLWDSFDRCDSALGFWLFWMMKNQARGRVLFLCILRETQSAFPDWDEEFRGQFFHLVEARRYIDYEILDVTLRTLAEPEGAFDGLQVLPWLHRARIFFSYGSWHRYEALLPKGSDAQAVEGEFRLGILLFFSEDYNRAGLLLQSAYEKSRKLGDPHYTARILFHVALANFRKKDRSQAGKFLALCEKSAQELSSRELEVFIGAARLLVDESLWESPHTHETWSGFVKSLEGGPYDCLVEILRSILSYFRGLVKVKGTARALAEAKETFDFHLAMDNTYHAAKLAHMLGFLHQDIDPSKALEYFRMSIGMRMDLGEPLELIKVYNGVGYFCFTIGETREAMGYFEKALALLETRRDFTETCLTMFNISNLFFFSGHFDNTLETLEKIFAVMKSLKMPNLPWHSRVKLYSMAGLAAYYQGWKTRALDYWNLISGAITDDEAYPPYALLQSLVRGLSHKDHLWERDLEKALAASVALNQPYFTAFIYMEIGRRWLALEDKARSAGAFQHARAILTQRKMTEQLEVLRHLEATGTWPQEQETHVFENPIRVITRSLGQSAQQEASSFALMRKVNELTFLKDFQVAIHRDLPEKTLFKKAFELIRQSFNLNCGLLVEGRKDEIKIHASFPSRSTLPPQGAWEKLWPRNRSLGVWSQEHEGHFYWAYPFKSQKSRHLWFWAEATLGGGIEEDFETLALALGHLEITLELRKAVEEIQDLLTTDSLTGALNRREFLRRAEAERGRCLRYSPDRGQVFSLVFLDLDNFKFYNDTYGHSAGDRVLKAFSALVRDHIREMDCLGRWGGDEFVLLLPETLSEGAKILAQRILTSLKDTRGMAEVVASELGHPVEIPAEKALGCSFGVETFSSGEQLSVAAILDRADKKLYEAKKQGKGRVV